MVVFAALVSWVPLLGSVPLHPPPAVHETALVEAQVKVEVSPGATTDGYTLKVAVGITLTVALALEEPPGPEQAREYEAGADNDPVLCVPLALTVPLQAPEAVHVVVLTELQVRSAAWPAATEAGDAESVTLAAGINVTVAETGTAVPPPPEQTSEYVVVAVMGGLACVPLGASVPLQPSDAVQESALVEFHVNDEVPPRTATSGVAVSVAAGRGLMVTAALTGALVPPAPEQVSTNVALPFNAPLLWLPLGGKAPLQPPEAAHADALLEFQVNVADPPAATAAGDAVSDAVGTGGGAPPPPPPHADKITGPRTRRQAKERTSSQCCFSSV